MTAMPDSRLVKSSPPNCRSEPSKRMRSRTTRLQDKRKTTARSSFLGSGICSVRSMPRGRAMTARSDVTFSMMPTIQVPKLTEWLAASEAHRQPVKAYAQSLERTRDEVACSRGERPPGGTPQEKEISEDNEC